VSWADTEGRWTVHDGKLDLEVGEESWQYTLTPAGALDNASGTAWIDSPSECEA